MEHRSGSRRTLEDPIQGETAMTCRTLLFESMNVKSMCLTALLLTTAGVLHGQVSTPAERTGLPALAGQPIPGGGSSRRGIVVPVLHSPAVRGPARTILSTALRKKLHEFRFAESCLVPPGRISSRVPKPAGGPARRNPGAALRPSARRFAALCLRPLQKPLQVDCGGAPCRARRSLGDFGHVFTKSCRERAHDGR